MDGTYEGSQFDRRRVSAVIVAYNSRDEIPRCLHALAPIVDLCGVVVVDHGCDGAAEVAETLGTVVVRDPSNPGFGAGQNHGVAETSSEYVLLLNPDAVVNCSGVNEGVLLLDDAPDVAAVQGVVHNRTSGRPERSQGVEIAPVHLLGRSLGASRFLTIGLVRRLARTVPGVADHVDRIPDAPTEVEALAATALLVRRKAFDEVGGFDEGYFLYGEDMDLCRRLRAAGWRLIALPVSWADHGSGASSAGWWERELVWWEGTLRYAARWWTSAEWALARLAAAIRLIPMLAARPRRAREIIRRIVVVPGRERVRRGTPPPS